MRMSEPTVVEATTPEPAASGVAPPDRSAGQLPHRTPELSKPASIVQANPGAFYRQHRAQTLAAMARVLDSGWYILGEEVRCFEEEFARHAGLAHAIGVANGTDAIALGLRALGVGRGDLVATVSHTAVATVAAIEMLGARPVFVDIVPGGYLMDAQCLEAVLQATPGIKAVVVVHLYGQAADVPSLCAVAARHGARVFEDCAQAHGARWDGRPVGSMGALGSFSFYPTKNLGALGDGGMVVTQDPELARQVRMLREYGWRERYVSDICGINSRLDEVQAALLRFRLPVLSDHNRRRAGIAATYERGLAPVAARLGLGLPDLPPELNAAEAGHVVHQYVVRHPARDRLRAMLSEVGIGTNVHYPVPVHLQPAYCQISLMPSGGLPNTEAAAREVLSLPMFPELEDAAVARVISCLVDALESLAR